MVAPRERLVFVDAGWGGNDGPWPFEYWDYDQYPNASGLLYDWGYSCGLRGDGSLLCWGNGSYLRENDLYYGEGPILSPPEGVFVDVGVGKHQACALRRNYTVECWGLYGNYVYGEGEDSVRFSSLDVGGWYACGRVLGGPSRCWDLRNQEQVLPIWVNSYGVRRGYFLISAGYFHVCGYRNPRSNIHFNIDRGGVDCWGPPITRELRSP